MRTSTPLKLVACGGAAVVAVSLASAPSQAEPAGGGRSTPAEVGCYDVVSGVASLTRRLQYQPVTKQGTTEPHSVNVLDPGHTQTYQYDTYDRTATPDADAALEVTLGSAPGEDCSAVRYRLRLYDETGAPIADTVVPGGTAGTVRWGARFAYPGAGRHAFFSVTTESASGRVGDTAPDDPAGAQVDLEGGGAVSSFK